MSSIPEEIYLEILLKLPVKSTLVCKCVCKRWYDLISNPNFVQTHHNLTTQKNKFSLMIFMSDYKLGNIICSASYDPSSVSRNEFHMYGVEINNPVGCANFDMRGFCNGLVCIWHKQKKVLCLWNPNSSEFRELPRILNRLNLFTCAFGIDYITGDYKLICLYYNGPGLVVYVYMVGPNSWKNTQVLDYKMGMDDQSGVLVNGFFHWLGDGRNGCVIISLDISSETFKEMKPPELPIEEKRWWSSVGELKECLCLVAYGGDVEVWVMQVYGVQESWTRHYTITNERIVKDFRLRPMWSFSGSGEILFKGCGNYRADMVLYDPKDGSVRKPNVHVENKMWTFPMLGNIFILKA